MKAFRFIILILGAVLVILTPIIIIPGLDKIYSLDLVKESKYKGVLMLYHVETFEGGSTSRARYLEKCAQELEKTERNLFILVRTMDVETLNNLLSEGSRPDIISFGTGLGPSIQNLLTSLDDDYGIRGVYSKSGQSGGNLLALPYMAGGYALIGDDELLKSAKVAEETPLSGCLDIEVKGKTKTIPALAVGKNAYINPKAALDYSTGNVFEQYAAYENFINKKSIMLLGTQRDLNRLIARDELGRGRAVRVEYLSGYTDLVQYLGVMTDDGYKQAAAKLYFEKVFSAYGQNELASTGMLSVTGKSLYSGGMLSGLEAALKSDNLKVKNVFEG